jgi:hypothetical protein
MDKITNDTMNDTMDENNVKHKINEIIEFFDNLRRKKNLISRALKVMKTCTRLPDRCRLTNNRQVDLVYYLDNKLLRVSIVGYLSEICNDKGNLRRLPFEEVPSIVNNFLDGWNV